MITNPEDTGIYNPLIDKFVEVVHDAGGVCFNDQANGNVLMGIARTRDAGFDALPLQPAQDVLHPARRLRARPPAPWAAATSSPSTCPYPTVEYDEKSGRTTSTTTAPSRSGKIKGFLGSAGVVCAPTPGAS